MAVEPSLAPETDISVQETLLAASQHNLTQLRRLLSIYSYAECASVDVQDPETGFSPLHATIAACEIDEVAVNGNGGSPNFPTAESNASDLDPQRQELLAGAAETVRFLLQNGAIWNQLDKKDETPGCLAYRLRLTELYSLMVDAGVRAEILLNRLDGYEELQDSDDEESKARDADQMPNSDVQAEEKPVDVDAAQFARHDVNSTQYLSSALSIDASKIMDEHSNGVMMSWESDIMAKSASCLLTRPDIKVLNIGFGMGIVDNHIQQHANRPKSHHIIEAHAAVLADMESKGWLSKPGVVVHKGRWQDVLPRLLNEGHAFDAIFFDTFAETYTDFRIFFSDYVVGLLNEAGNFSFFNGMGADRQISYDVYQKVVEIDLLETGFDVVWHDVPVPTLDHEWDRVKRKYWNVGNYRLPVCSYAD